MGPVTVASRIRSGTMALRLIEYDMK